MKVLKISIVIFVFSILLAASSSANVVDRIVAVVNDDIITLSELNRDIEAFLKRIEKTSEVADRESVAKQLRMTVLRELINQKLIEQEAKKLGIVASDKDIDDAIKNIITQKKISMEAFQEAIAREGGTFDEYKEELRQHLTRMNLLGREIKSKIAVSREEIGNYYREHRDDYEGKEAVRINQILIIVPRDNDAEVKKERRILAGETLNRLKSGESFRLLAVEVSQGPAAKAGGDLGYIEKGMMLPEVDEVAFALEKGEISEIIESPIGFHIIQVIDKRGAGIKPIESVREEIIGKIGSVKVEKRFQEWLKEQWGKSLIDIRL